MKIWHKVLRNGYEEAHPSEVGDDASYPLPWRRGRCNAQDKYGNTPLYYAALAGNVEVVKQYVALPDVDPTVRNNDGETPFDFSLENRDCALALRGRLQELGIEVFDSGSSTPIVSKTKSCQAADKFVEGSRRKLRIWSLPARYPSLARSKKRLFVVVDSQGSKTPSPLSKVVRL